MLAIHNVPLIVNPLATVANAFAKLSKCQQFTTPTRRPFRINRLQTLLQSYQNVSNSQLQQKGRQQGKCCKRFCKVIKMLAIHNHQYFLHIHNYVANAFAKLSKCQQFTTNKKMLIIQQTLQTLLQSYQNVSNSQLYVSNFKIPGGCKRFCKVIKMLAIHNDNILMLFHNYVANAFAKLSKCQQFTTASVFRL